MILPSARLVEILELEQLLGDDDVAFHADHLGDVGGAARTVAEALDLDDEVDRIRDLAADRLLRDLDVAPSSPCFPYAPRHSRGVLEWSVAIEPSWPVFIAASRSKHSWPRISPRMMRSGRIRRALMTRSRMVIAPWPSRFGGRVSSGSQCGCCKPKLGRVLDGDHALARVDHLRQGVEHGRLARAGTARDDDVHAAGAGDLEHRRHLLRHRAEAAHHVERDRLFGEFTNRDGGAAQATAAG